MYNVDDVKKGIPEPFGRYAIWMPAEAAKATASGYHKKKDFMENTLVIARAGTLEHLDDYFEKAKDSDGDVGNWCRLVEIDFRQPQDRLLFVLGTNCGIGGKHGSLYDFGSFVGVAPEVCEQSEVDLRTQRSGSDKGARRREKRNHNDI